MSRDFAIGCMRGGAWAFGLCAAACFIVAFITPHHDFIWLTIGLELAALLLIVLKTELERSSK